MSHTHPQHEILLWRQQNLYVNSVIDYSEIGYHGYNNPKHEYLIICIINIVSWYLTLVSDNSFYYRSLSFEDLRIFSLFGNALIASWVCLYENMHMFFHKGLISLYADFITHMAYGLILHTNFIFFLVIHIALSIIYFLVIHTSSFTCSWMFMNLWQRFERLKIFVLKFITLILW